MTARWLFPAALALLLIACDGPTGPSIPWPADGRTPAEGIYSYSISWQDPLDGSTSNYSGEIELANATSEAVEFTVAVDGFWDSDEFARWKDGAYEVIYHATPEANVHQRFERPDGKAELDCDGVVRLSGAAYPDPVEVPASCTMEWTAVGAPAE